MPLAVKICGLRDQEALTASVEAGAALVGFVFVASSPRFIAPENARPLLQRLAPSSGPRSVGLWVDPTDEALKTVLAIADVDYLQLHGQETPERLRTIGRMTEKKIIKTLHVRTAEDLQNVAAYEAVADMLLFDVKTGDTPTGGTGKTFDWSLLKGKTFAKPWLLAGGLNLDNVERAVAVSGASMVDLSSGLESAPGQKDPAKIRAFLALTQTLGRENA